MKIAIVIDDRGDHLYSYTVIARRLVEAARSRGDRPILVCNRTGGAPARQTRYGAPCFLVGRLGAFYHRWLAAAQIMRILRRERVDLVHLHLAGLDRFGFFVLAALTRVRFVLSLHEFQPERVRSMGRRHSPIMALLLKRAAAVTAVSGFVAEAARRRHAWAAGKLRVVPNGAGFQAPREPSGPLPRRFILTVGTLCAEKGTDLALFALKSLDERLPEGVRWVFCGEDQTGKFPELIRRLGLSHRVVLIGPRPHDEIAGLLERCEFFVSASRRETFGMAVAEAMSAGKAVIAPRGSSFPEYIVHEEDGLLSAPGDIDGLAGAIERLMGDPALARRLGANARRTALRFRWDAVTTAYQEVYDEALSLSR